MSKMSPAAFAALLRDATQQVTDEQADEVQAVYRCMNTPNTLDAVNRAAGKPVPPEEIERSRWRCVVGYIIARVREAETTSDDDGLKIVLAGSGPLPGVNELAGMLAGIEAALRKALAAQEPPPMSNTPLRTKARWN